MYRNQNQRDFARTLRNESSPAEKRLWHFLRAGQLRGHKFRRQARAPSAADGRGAYVVDFVCFSMKLVVELDGPQHLEPAAVEHDTQRTKWLAARGYRVVRFRNQELDEDIRAVVDAIERTLMELEALAGNPPHPFPPRGGSQSSLIEKDFVALIAREQRPTSHQGYLSGSLPVDGDGTKRAQATQRRRAPTR